MRFALGHLFRVVPQEGDERVLKVNPYNFPCIANNFEGDAVLRTGQQFSSIDPNLVVGFKTHEEIDNGDGTIMKFVLVPVKIGKSKTFWWPMTTSFPDYSSYPYQVVFGVDLISKFRISYYMWDKMFCSEFGTIPANANKKMRRFKRVPGSIQPKDMNYGNNEDTTRVILLIDMDSFEVQVHQKSMPESVGKPCVVINPSGRIVAVSYEAKKLGINRDRTPQLHQARRLLPQLIAIPIPEREAGRPDTRIARAATFQIVTAIKETIRQFYPSAILESASGDEFYIDVSAAVEESMDNYRKVRELWWNTYMYSKGKKNGLDEIRNWLSGLQSTSAHFLDTCGEQELRLLHGAAIANCVMKEILQRTGYKASVGIALNKLVAKIASGLHKPGSVTICAPSGWKTFSKDIKTTDIPTLGGKRGEMLRDAGYPTMRDLQKLNPDDIGQEIYSHGVFITDDCAEAYWRCAQGICDKPVIPKEHHGANAIVSQIFNRPISLSEIKHIVNYLGFELLGRLREERTNYKREPIRLSVKIELKNAENMYEALGIQINPYQKVSNQFFWFLRELKMDFWNKYEEYWNDSDIVSKVVLTAKFEEI